MSLKSIPDIVAKLRFKYHANALSVNNVLNQLRILSNDKAEERNKKHMMTIIDDILPRMFGQKAVDEFFNK